MPGSVRNQRSDTVVQTPLSRSDIAQVRRRWIIDRTIGWLQNSRRLVTRESNRKAQVPQHPLRQIHFLGKGQAVVTMPGEIDPKDGVCMAAPRPVLWMKSPDGTAKNQIGKDASS